MAPVLWAAVALAWEMGSPLARRDDTLTRTVTSVVFSVVGVALVVGAFQRLRRELRQIHAVADAAQQALLRPLPHHLDGLSVAGVQLPAVPGAAVGGDLYEAVATPYGVRVIIGDVRGHGLAALGAVAAVLGSFREAAHEEPGLGGLLRRLERALQRYVSERQRDEGEAAPGAAGNPSAEEFVTVLLLDLHPNGDVLVLNCGHPWPYRIGDGAEPLAVGEPLPPLGAFPLPDTLPVRRCARLLPGEALFLHTDGAEEARDTAGRFFPLDAVLAGAAEPPRSPDEVIDHVRTALLAHTGGRLTDDVAFVVVRDDRTPAAAPCAPAPGPRPARTAPSSR
ncbi:PP2C family protein-serine/threonine phosphatase [Streptomyces sp. DH12]|uniref:PP2C family protein-serine/threonine phosphatase n=1 Tax=Streptomyces sp. DH12 TaxID=2857010 RepID=UPI001E39934B|nr:PP2C family protein-serine/threonine phosphatase [Streptomyces sp. DH12]